MTSGSPINRPVMPHFNAGSALRSPLDKDDLTNQHKNNKVTNSSTFNLAGQVAQLVGNELKKRRRIMTPPQAQSEIQPFHPFQIYKPEIKKLNFQVEGDPPTIQSSWMNFESLGWTFDPITFSLTQITFDSTVPTDFSTGTINPVTDGWRIWAVRTGLVSCRNGENSPSSTQIFDPGSDVAITMPDLATANEVSGCDGYSIGGRELTSNLQFGFPYEFNPSTDNGQFEGVTPIVLPSSFVDNDHSYILSLWIQSPTAGAPALMGRAFDFDSTGGNVLFPVPQTGQTIPLGAIANVGFESQLQNSDTDGLTAYQFIYGNMVDRYGVYRNSFLENETSDPLGYNATLNFRGSWQNDAITTGYFYPGDVVKFQTSMTIGGTTVYSENLYMCAIAGTSSNPSTDPNWTMISGIRLTSDTDETPDTT